MKFNIYIILYHYYEKYTINPKTIYGDSVSGSTPLLLKGNNII